MSNLLRKVENIKIDGKDYILAFDMESIEVFKDLTGKGVVAILEKTIFQRCSQCFDCHYPAVLLWQRNTICRFEGKVNTNGKRNVYLCS